MRKKRKRAPGAGRKPTGEPSQKGKMLGFRVSADIYAKIYAQANPRAYLENLVITAPHGDLTQ